MAHTYTKAGTFQLSIQATDADNRVAFLTVASIVNGQPDTVAAAADFVDPVLDGLDGKAVWSPAERSWSTAPVTPLGPTETAIGRTDL